MEVLHLKKKLPNPSEGLRAYLIIISPPANIKQDVFNFKTEFFLNFGTARYIRSTAHISLSNFLIESTPEVTILNELHYLLKNKERFEVHTLGFDWFLYSNTLFLSVSENEIVNLQHHMVAVLRRRVKIGCQGTRKLEGPHITIASKIPDYQFERSCKYFGEKNYSKAFMVDKVTVLRKNLSLNESHYNVAFETGLK
jgi:2'-5' RNA ligase